MSRNNLSINDEFINFTALEKKSKNINLGTSCSSREKHVNIHLSKQYMDVFA